MAIYHLHMKVIGRSSGASAVAAAAYRSASRLRDERIERSHDFSAKRGVVHSEVLLPEGAPEDLSDRERLWNAVEAGEIRRDAQLARELEFALPRELTQAQAIDLARDFVHSEFVDRGMIADLNVHWDRTDDGLAKPHAHVMLTMRSVDEDGFGPKVREWNRTDLLERWRERWAGFANARLAELDIDARIDHRSLEAQGIALEPQDKIGAPAQRIMRAGDEADRAEMHRSIARENGTRIIADPGLALDAITRQQATFTRRDMAAFAHCHSDGRGQFDAVLGAMLRAPDLVALGRDARGDERFGAIVDAEDFKPWLHDARINGEVGDFYWGRYRRLLGLKGLPKSVIDGTDEVTDRVLDRLGNPNNLSPWSRRGMVVGHVQSGKTANYTGLICKAADAGYRLIVVIAGIHNNLRNQTQARIDEGFIGRDTGRLAHANKAQRQKIIGVGQFDQREFPVSLTNTLRDFNKATATTFTAQLSQINVPVVLVIKKNSSTLKNLLEWLKEHSVHQSTQMVSQPMLLIDDEADNASINTAYQRDEVTRINSQIRELLSLFHRSCYVGYTATPFANIFIDPDTDDEALKQDLFPRDFIIGLDAPSNYFGAQKIFLDARDQHIRLIDDNEDVLPIKHKIDHPVDVLPGSLVEAVRAFIVARAIRNARGQQAGHASMLVNASRFTDVQGRLRSRIADVVARIRDAVAVDAAKGPAALRNPEIAALHATWKREFADAEGADWPSVQARLHEVLVAARVVEVNASKRAQALDYDHVGEHGITVIAVGGFSLSRGLTLEGLTVSYFLRNSMMYDTLMQMGRWFGYRPGYEDLCRVLMPADGVGWYAHIHEAMDDLQTQLKRMELAKATPAQFGLAVRSHPEALIVTARNKMGTGKELPVKVGLAENLIETTRIVLDHAQLDANLRAGEELLSVAASMGIPRSERPRGYLLSGMGVEAIKGFLRKYRTEPGLRPVNPLTDPKLINDYIDARADDELAKWDVFIASSTRKDVPPIRFAGLDIVPYELSVDPDLAKGGVLAFSGSSRRIGSAEDEAEGLSEAQINEARKNFFGSRSDKPKTVNPRIYRQVPGRRPLLILRLVKPKLNDPIMPEGVLVWGLSFPSSGIDGGTVEYVVNTIRMREMFGEEEIEEEALGDPE